MSVRYNMPTKLHFGSDKINDLTGIANQYGKKCLLVSFKDTAPLNAVYSKIKKLLISDGFEVIHFDKVMPDPTTEIVEKGVEILNKNDIDFVVAIGGGSSIDTAKMICLLNDFEPINWEEIFSVYTDAHANYEPLSKRYIPLIAIPTTAGTGSEVTQAAVISSNNEKITIFHPLNYADEAILDPILLTTLPKKLTASTGFDAFSHAFESYINANASPFSELASLEAIKSIKEYLVKSVDNPLNIEYREKLLYAQTLAGIGLSNSGASAPHPLSEIIGGITGISHGESLALIFPEFLHLQYPLNIPKFATVARIFDEGLITSSDEQAASQLSSIIKKLLIDIDLYYKFDDYHISNEQYHSIIDCPVLGFLPFGTKDSLQKIISNSKELR